MRKSLLYAYSDEEFRAIVAASTTHAECLRNLGYNTNSGNVQKAYYARLAELKIDISHITTHKPRIATPELVFVENCTYSNATLRRHYIKVCPPTCCAICNRKPEWEGKPLTLILDHINGIHSDSRLENLRWVCPNCNSQLETTNGKNKHQHQPKIKQCMDCGTIINTGSTRCNTCEQNRRQIATLQQLHLKISREDLKAAIRTASFESLGTKFNVTGTTIKQWCRIYHLPYKKSDIKRYTDEEWDAI